MKEYKYNGLTWDVVTDTTLITMEVTSVDKGVARHEFIEKSGSPEDMEKLVNERKSKLLYAWNIKVLAREILNKDNLIKMRETITLQAEGLHGEGKQLMGSDSNQSARRIIKTKNGYFDSSTGKRATKKEYDEQESNNDNDEVSMEESPINGNGKKLDANEVAQWICIAGLGALFGVAVFLLKIRVA